jgi:hypothetical protein
VLVGVDHRLDAFGYFFFPVFVWWLWIVVASALVVRRQAMARATFPQPAL